MSNASRPDAVRRRIWEMDQAGDLGSLSDLPQDYLEQLRRELSPGLSKLLADVITVLLKRINVPDSEIEEITDKLYERSVQTMFAWADNYDVQETRRVARAEGLPILCYFR